MNTLPIQTYVRQRIETIVVDIDGESAGSIPLALEKPSDVTVIIASDYFSGGPAIFVAALDRVPSLTDFDVIVSPADDRFVKQDSRVTLHLPAGTFALQWKSVDVDGTPTAFPIMASRLVLAVDQ